MPKPKILLVDDSEFIRIAGKQMLEPQYEVFAVTNGQEALEFLRDNPMDLILLDINMPVMDGVETLRQLRLQNLLGQIPVIVLTGNTQSELEEACLRLGARDFIQKPFNLPALLCRVHGTLELQQLQSNLENKVREKTREVERMTLQTVRTFAFLVDARDPSTHRHSEHVAHYAEQMGRVMGLSETELLHLFYAALLHDVGLVVMPDFLLTKAGRLTLEEYEMLKMHTRVGGDILRNIDVMPELELCARYHHEYYDGNGYPDGKKGSDIPLVARIVAVADAADAMLSERSYRDALTLPETIAELRRCSGTQFDPMAADVMCALLNGDIKVETKFDLSAEAKNIEELVSSISELSRNSQRDTLTGLWRRSYLEQMVDMREPVEGAQDALLLFDIDNFKNCNVSYGVDVGDFLIHCLSEVVRASIEEDDIPCHFYSDKFAIYCCNVTSLASIEQRVRKIIDGISLQAVTNDVPAITLSFGAALRPHNGENFDALYRCANIALQAVKQKGKNAFCFYSKKMEEEK